MSGTISNSKAIAKKTETSASVQALLREYQALTKGQAQRLDFDKVSEDLANRQSKRSTEKHLQSLRETEKSANPLLTQKAPLLKSSLPQNVQESFLPTLNLNPDAQLTPEAQTELCEKLSTLNSISPKSTKNQNLSEDTTKSTKGKRVVSESQEDDSFSMENEGLDKKTSANRSASLSQTGELETGERFSHSDGLAQRSASLANFTSAQPSAFQETSSGVASSSLCKNEAMMLIFQFLEKITDQETELIKQFNLSENSVLSMNIQGTTVFAESQNRSIKQNYNATISSSQSQYLAAGSSIAQGITNLAASGYELWRGSKGSEGLEASHGFNLELGQELEKVSSNATGRYHLSDDLELGEIKQLTGDMDKYVSLHPHNIEQMNKVVGEYEASDKLDGTEVRNAFAKHMLTSELDVDGQGSCISKIKDLVKTADQINMDKRQENFLAKVKEKVSHLKNATAELNTLRTEDYKAPLGEDDLEAHDSAQLEGFLAKHNELFSKGNNNSVFAIEKLPSAEGQAKQKISAMYVRDIDGGKKKLVILTTTRSKSAEPNAEWTYTEHDSTAIEVKFKEGSSALKNIYKNTAAWLGHHEGQSVSSSFAKIAESSDTDDFRGFKGSIINHEVKAYVETYHKNEQDLQHLIKLKRQFGFGDLDEKSTTMGARLARSAQRKAYQHDKNVRFHSTMISLLSRGSETASHIASAQGTAYQATASKAQGVQQLVSSLDGTRQQVNSGQTQQLGQETGKLEQSRSETRQAAASALQSVAGGR